MGKKKKVKLNKINKSHKTSIEAQNLSEKHLVYPMPATRWQTQYFIFKQNLLPSGTVTLGVGRGGQVGRDEGASQL